MPKDNLYTKFFRFRATSPSTLEALDKSGYGAITMTMSGNNIIISSSAEFLSTVNLDDSQNSSCAWINSSTIRFTPEPYLDWGITVGEIVEK